MAIPYAPKLRLAPLWPALAALVLAAVLAGSLLPGAVAEQAVDELSQFLRLIEPTLPRPSAPGGAPDLALQRKLVAFAARSDFRITLIRLDGAVLADSALDDEGLAAVENHLARAEITAAIEHGEGVAVRESTTTGMETAYAARLAIDPAGPAFVARLALPIRSLAAYRRHLTQLLALAALGAVGVALVLSWWLSRSLFEPLGRLIAAAGRIGAGDYRTPVPVPEQTELAALARALERIEREAERQLAAAQAERDHLRDTVGSMAEGVLVVDPAGRPLLANAAFHALFALPPDAPAASLLDLAREPRLGDLVVTVRASGTTRSTELERVVPQGAAAAPTSRRLALVATPLSAGGGVVLVARDVTEAERLHQMRKEFVANVSHELKTPLAAIRGFAETLVDGALDDRATALRFSERILEQCRRLGDLLDDLLTLSRLEGTEALRGTERVDLHEVAEEALELVRARAAAKPVTLELAPGAGPFVEGDADGLLRLFSNLLDNAIKYNHPGGVVRVRLAERDGRALVEVEDSGIGIPAAQLDRIFERFYRVDKGRAREEGGTGLGLAIVKHVAQAHRGRVEVTSELGRGSIFRVHLPVAR